MMSTLIRSFLLAILLVTSTFADPPKLDTLLLWPDGAPNAKGTDDRDKPSLSIHPALRDTANGAAVIICPGGGYNVLAIDHEGLQIARRLNDLDVTAFILSYRLKPAKYTPADALLDAQRAVRLVRSRAKEFGVSPSRIGMLGFSAGGHLTASAATQFTEGDADAKDPIDRAASRPDFIVLCYPVTAQSLRKEYPDTLDKVTTKTPPAFIWFTHEDGLDSDHGILFYQALKKAKVEAELHILSRGAHGLGLAPGDPLVSQWFPLLGTWLRNSKWLTDEPRVAVSGKITIDGKPLHRGWVTLVPTDSDVKPIACAYITERAAGKFQINATHGPCAGNYRVEVREVAQQFLAVPSMEDERLFTKSSPAGKALTWEIKASGAEGVFEIESKASK